MKAITLIFLMTVNCSTLPKCGINRLVWSFGPKDPYCRMETFGTVSQELVPYIEAFQKDAAYYGVSCWGTLYVKVVNEFTFPGLGPQVVGVCYPHLGVEISRSYWEDSTEWERKALMYHELGHCSLGLEHVQTRSIMLPYIEPPRDEVEWNFLVRQMFTKEVKGAQTGTDTGETETQN